MRPWHQLCIELGGGRWWDAWVAEEMLEGGGILVGYYSDVGGVWALDVFVHYLDWKFLTITRSLAEARLYSDLNLDEVVCFHHRADRRRKVYEFISLLLHFHIVICRQLLLVHWTGSRQFRVIWVDAFFIAV